MNEPLGQRQLPGTSSHTHEVWTRPYGQAPFEWLRMQEKQKYPEGVAKVCGGEDNLQLGRQCSAYHQNCPRYVLMALPGLSGASQLPRGGQPIFLNSTEECPGH